LGEEAVAAEQRRGRDRRLSDQQAALLLESLREYGLFALDVDGTIASWSGGTERLFGWTAADVLGASGGVIFPREHQPREILERQLALAATGESAEWVGWLVRKDDRPFWGSCVTSAVRDGHLRGYAVIVRDLSEQKTLEEALKARVAELTEVNRSKDQFLATLSHELRTPLNAILGYTQMLRQGVVQGQSVDRALEVIERNARAQHRLVVDLLNTAQFVRGTIRLHPEPVDLASVLAESIDTIRPAADAKHITIRAQLRPGSSISGDPMRLHQIFANVLTNAVKFTPKRGRLDVGVAAEASSALVTIHDTGAGIAPEFLSHAFEPFSQEQPSGGGMGLGLSIVRHLVELHGATVSAASEGLGKGTTVSFTFPLLAVNQAGAGWMATGEWANVPRLDGIHVLVVDDDPEARRLITLVLERAGATVVAVGTAAEGFATIQQREPDILVADIGLPDEDGYAFLGRIRRQPSPVARVPAVALTGYAGIESRRRALLAGFHTHVVKPVEPLELTAVVAALVGRAGVARGDSPGA
jgi:PAS domain S-box-containing protein